MPKPTPPKVKSKPDSSRAIHEPVERCPHPEYVKPFTPNRMRNRRPSGNPDIEWCEYCWKGLPVNGFHQS